MRQRGNFTMIVLIVLGVVAFGLLISGLICTGLYNSEVDLRVSYGAQEKNCMNHFDKMWKTISQQAQIADKYKDSFYQVFTDGMKLRREGQDQLLFSWIQEHNPAISEAVFMKLMDTIESERTAFAREQEILINIHAEHKRLINKLPGSVFFALIGRKELELKIITSERTEEVYRNGQDNDVDLFPKKSSPEKEQ